LRYAVQLSGRRCGGRAPHVLDDSGVRGSGLVAEVQVRELQSSGSKTAEVLNPGDVGQGLLQVGREAVAVLGRVEQRVSVEEDVILGDRRVVVRLAVGDQSGFGNVVDTLVAFLPVEGGEESAFLIELPKSGSR